MVIAGAAWIFGPLVLLGVGAALAVAGVLIDVDGPEKG